MRYSAAIVAIILAASAQAENLDGSSILAQEAQRAQELQRLQHQAELLKQRAEITRYLDEIEKNGGDVSDLGLTGINTGTGTMRRRSASSEAIPVAPAAVNKTDQDSIPRLLHIEDNRAAFATVQGTLYAGVGGTLPGGYKIVALSLRDGVRLQKNGVQYDIDVAW